MKLEQGFLVEKLFKDSVNFPYGFRKSGDFSIPEADLLATLGNRLASLEQKVVEPENQVEKNFVEMCEAGREAQTKVELLWQKYLKLTKPKRFHSLNGGGITKVNAVEDSYPSEDE